MKKMILFGLLVALLFSSFAVMQHTAYAEPHVMVFPLPDDTMESLTDAILSVSFEEGDVYLDDTGKLQMKARIYTYDQYDLVDIGLLQAGDVLMTHAGEVEVISVVRNDSGRVVINGGWEAGGLELITDECYIYYAVGANDTKDWYQLGEATIRVSVDFRGYDQADLEQGEIVFYPGSFLVNEVTNYDFTPYNTTIRVEAGQVVELHRRYIP